MSQQLRNNASEFVNRPTPYVRRTSQPDTKTKTTPQPHPRVVEALNRLLASTFTVCLRWFCCLVCFPFLMSIIGFWDHWCFGSSVSIVTDCMLDGWCLIPGRAEISVCFLSWMKLTAHLRLVLRLRMSVAARTLCPVPYDMPLNEVQGQLLCIYNKSLVIVWLEKYRQLLTYLHNLLLKMWTKVKVY